MATERQKSDDAYLSDCLSFSQGTSLLDPRTCCLLVLVDFGDIATPGFGPAAYHGSVLRGYLSRSPGLYPCRYGYVLERYLHCPSRDTLHVTHSTVEVPL